MKKGPTHFDLTEEEDLSGQRQSPIRSPPRHSASPAPQSESHNLEEEIIEDADPVRVQKPSFLYKLYCALKSTGTPLNYIDDFLKDKNYGNEYLFLKKMEEWGIAPKGKAEEALANIPRDPRMPGQNLIDANDDDKMFLEFEPRMGVAAKAKGNRMDLFKSKDQEKVYYSLLKRGVINPRSVDFDFLDSINLNLREKLNLLQLETFCSDSTDGYDHLTAYFYSNLSFLDANRISFSVRDKVYVVDVNMLADIVGVERGRYLPIKVSPARTTLDLVKDRDVDKKIIYSRMNAINIVLHKIVINCLRPKSTSKTSVSLSEAKLMYAINSGRKFSLPHTILFHMYRTVSKDKGQLPYPGLVTKIFRHLNIELPHTFCVRPCDKMVVGLKMLMKMRLQELSKAMEKFKVKSPVQSASKGKGKKAFSASSKKRKRILILEDEDEDEDDEDPTIPALTRTRRSVSYSTELQQSREEEEQREKEKEVEEEKEEVKDQSADKSGEKGNQEIDHHSSPFDVLETGGVSEQERSPPHAAEDQRKSPEDPEEAQVSQLPEEDDTTIPNLQDRSEAPSSAHTPSEKANASTQTDDSVDLRSIMNILLEMRNQIYILDCEIQVLKHAGQASSVSLEEKYKDLALQLQANAKREEVAHLREDLKKLEGVVQSIGDFQIVRIPKQT